MKFLFNSLSGGNLLAFQELGELATETGAIAVTQQGDGFDVGLLLHQFYEREQQFAALIFRRVQSFQPLPDGKGDFGVSQ